MFCRSIAEQTIAIVCATYNDGINKELSGFACKILSNTSYVVQMERDGVTQLISTSDHAWSCFLRTRGPFLESPNTFLCPQSCFVFVVFAFKVKVPIIFQNDTMKPSN